MSLLTPRATPPTDSCPHCTRHQWHGLPCTKWGCDCPTSWVEPT